MTDTCREVSSKSNITIQKLATFLNSKDITPNTISTFSIVFSLLTPIGCYLILLVFLILLLKTLMIFYKELLKFNGLLCFVSMD